MPTKFANIIPQKSLFAKINSFKILRRIDDDAYPLYVFLYESTFYKNVKTNFYITKIEVTKTFECIGFTGF